MQTFKDSKGRAWEIDVTLGSLSLVKSRTGLDLKHIVTGDLRTSLGEMADPEKLFDVLLALTEKQRQDQNVSPEDFGAALNDADLVESAMEAVINGTVDFFPPRTRAALQSALGTIKKVGTEIRARAIEKADQAVKTLEAKAAEVLNPSTSKPNAGSSPESSVSTPAGTATASST